MTTNSTDTRSAPVPTGLKPLSLRISFSWTLAANLVTAASSVVILSLLAKLGSPEIVGQYTLGVTIGTLVLALPELSLRAVQCTDARDRYVFAEYLGLRLVGLLVGWAVIAGVAVFGGYRAETALIVALIGLSMGVVGVSDIAYGQLQRYEQTHRMAASMIIRAALSVVAIGAAMTATKQVTVACAALIFASASVCVWYDFPAVRRALLAATGAAPVRPSWDAARLSPLFRLALPLGITNALNLLYFHVARLVVVRYHGEGDLGIYAASAQIAAAGYLVTAAMATAVAPRMARLFADRQWAAFARLMVVFGGVSLVLGAATLLVGAIAGGALLTVLYTPEYAKQPAVLLWLLGAAAINFISTCFGTALTVSRHFNIQLALGIVSVATALLVSVWLVPRIGMVGAGIAAAATSSVRLVGLGAMFWVAFSRAKRPPPVDDGATAAWLGGK